MRVSWEGLIVLITIVPVVSFTVYGCTLKVDGRGWQGVNRWYRALTKIGVTLDAKSPVQKIMSHAILNVKNKLYILLAKTIELHK